jgi:hypothetical protein
LIDADAFHELGWAGIKLPAKQAAERAQRDAGFSRLRVHAPILLWFFGDLFGQSGKAPITNTLCGQLR